MRKELSVLFAVAVLVGMFAVLGALATPQASAWQWSSKVNLRGSMQAPLGNTVTWAWVEASNGERGWAWLGSGGLVRPYGFTFYRVPAGYGMLVYVRAGLSVMGQRGTTFRVSRPWSGETATVNIGWAY